MEAALNGPSGRTILGPADITLGRLSSNQVMVNDPKASSRHATLHLEGQSYSITDLGSTNGTFVNEQKLSPNAPYTLNPGDRIRIGDTTFTYEVTGAPPIPQTVYGNAGQGYDPTVAAASPYANNPGYLPTEAAAPYGQYDASPAPAYQPPPDYQVPPAQPAYQAPPAPYSPYGAPAQPAYGAPAPGFVTPGAPPSGKRNNRTLWIILGIVGGVVVLGIIACVAIFAVVANSSTPTKTLDTFCNALKTRDYQTAYNQLSTFRKTKISESDFANLFTPANSCTYSTPSESGSSATTTLTFFTNSGSVDGPTNMVQENGVWKIDAINLPSQ